MSQDEKLNVGRFRALIQTNVTPFTLLSFTELVANVSLITNSADVENQMDVRRSTVAEIDTFLTSANVDRNGIDIFV